jgi:quinol monooxygenase YgiN
MATMHGRSKCMVPGGASGTNSSELDDQGWAVLARRLRYGCGHAEAGLARRSTEHPERRRLVLGVDPATPGRNTRAGGDMTSITKDNQVATLINVFTVDPKDQQRLVDLLTQATDSIIKHLPGFVSTSIHKSADGARVVNYAQWRAKSDLEAMLNNPEAQAHIRPIMTIAQSDAHVYNVVETVSTT